MINIKSNASKSYLVRHLDRNSPSKAHDPNSWHDKGHTITIIRGEDGPNDTRDLLYVDHVHIHRDNWQWIHKRNELVWKQRQRPLKTAGHIGFSDDARVGAGSMQIGDEDQMGAVQLGYLHPSYAMALSSNAGAYVAGENELTLKWDTNSEKWRNAVWDDRAMKFTYWLEDMGKIGDDTIWQTAVVFRDNHRDVDWDVQPRGPGGAFSVELEGSGKFIFSLNGGYQPPDMGIKDNIFPFKMVFDFDELAQNIEGGAMLCDERSLKGKVYAIKGTAQNHFIAGTYKVYHSGTFHTLLTTHRQRLVIDGVMANKSGISGDKLWWQDLTADESTKANLPQTGFVEFSPDGTVVTHSSFGVEGFRVHAKPEPQSSLSIYDLLSMNPYQPSKDGVLDVIQQSAMEGFYKVLQYYMPLDYLHDFIAANPPDLGDIKDIAEDNKANAEWYSKLSVPYLVNALKTSDRDKVKHLNARRAQAVMKEYTGTAKIYNDQTTKLYSHEWQKKFSLMTQFMYDQSQNTEHHRDLINQSSDEWKKQIQEGLSEATDEDEQKELQQMLDLVENSRKRGLQGQYWSYMLFKYLASPSYLSMLRLSMTQGNTSSQQITQNLQRYGSILSILDPSGYFMQEFVDLMQIFHFTSLLPSFIDLSNDFEEISMFVPMIKQQFLDTYVNGTDPKMRDYAKKVKEALAKNNLKEYLKILYDVGSTIGSSSWINVCREFTNKVVQKFGQAASFMGNFILLGSAASAIVQLSTGLISFNDMSPAQRADFIASCIKVTALFIRKGIQAVFAFQTGESLWVSFRVFFGSEIKMSINSMTSNFGRWVLRNSSTPPTSVAVDAEVAMNMAEGAFTEDFIFEVQYPRLCKLFGRNLGEFMATRFAAAMAIFGIVLSGIALGESHDPMSIAMNSLFLASAVLNLVSVAAGWAVTEGITTVGGFGLATMCSVASAFSIFAAIAGVVIMFVFLFTHKQPPNPIDEFVDSEVVKNGGYFMEFFSAVDYFQVIFDEDGKPRDVGVALAPGTENKSPCLTVRSDGSLVISPLSHGFDTVLSVSTDYEGHSIFASRVFDQDNIAKVLVLTLDDSAKIMMQKPETDKDKQKQQRWTVTCVNKVEFDSDDHLVSGPFTIENVGRPGFFLDSDGYSVSASNGAIPWTLSMQGMKPERLTFPNIFLSKYDKDRKFYPCLGQVGSISGQIWFVAPQLPEFLELNDANGLITQKSGQEPPEFPTQTFQIRVRNTYGEAQATFEITVAGPM
ncbi:uncharacterized protein [Ptychodera flava]|uniref:uncharacterized protein n=1 Tax=Ptychodera flava TaxID=63121 RepID=UPI00396A35B1